MSAYLENFSDRKSIEDAYQCEIPAEAEILLAWYGYGDYCGSSLVIFRRNGELYEVNGGHCSCTGLEDQWEPEKTTTAALRTREFYDHYDGVNEAKRQLNELCDSLDKAKA
ncbi:MAG: hypothetical protein KGL39_31185 [Patescibacteria group bacterium]|nr:hypothetical protein [Patescibacteria group bacterium]